MVIPLADHSAILIDVATGRQIGNTLVGPVHYRWKSLAFSPTGSRILTVSSGYTARIWDSETGQPIGNPIAKNTDQAVFSPDGTRIVTLSSHGTIRTWNSATADLLGKPLADLHEMPNDVKLSSDGTSRILVGFQGGTTGIWDVEIGHWLGDPLPAQFLHDFCFSPDGTRILSYAHNNSWNVWDIARGQHVCALFVQGIHNANIMRPLGFSSDANRCFAQSVDGVRIWDATTGRLLVGPFGSGPSATFLAPDGTKVFLLNRTNLGYELTAWDCETGLPLGGSVLGDKNVYRGKFSPDGTKVFTFSSTGEAQIWGAKVVGRLSSADYSGLIRYLMKSR